MSVNTWNLILIFIIYSGLEELPISDEAERVNLITILWDHGLIVTDGPLPLCDSDSDDVSDSSESD